MGFSLSLLLVFAGAGTAQVPSFRTQQIDASLKVGYAVVLEDVDGDGKRDIVVVDSARVIWFRNPTWKLHTIIQGGTRPDNVCISAHDIDRDGKLDFALGADWKPFNTKSGGTLQWLRQGKTPTEPFSIHPIDEEPVIHRIRFADVDGDGRPELVSVPLMGRGSSAKGNWMDGSPVRIVAYHVPKNPTKDRWVPELLDASLNVIHNFDPVPAAGRKGMDVLTASYLGVHLLERQGEKWTRKQLGSGNQENLKGKRGASEIRQGKLKNGKKFIATIEPWHGTQVVVYTEPDQAGGLWHRQVLDERLRWGHAVACADLDGDGGDELIIGVRDDPSPKESKEIDRRGVRVYKAQDEAGRKWSRTLVENGGVAVEDLAAGDLDGDGRIDLVAVGRQTGNVRVYWNEAARGSK